MQKAYVKVTDYANSHNALVEAAVNQPELAVFDPAIEANRTRQPACSGP